MGSFDHGRSVCVVTNLHDNDIPAELPFLLMEAKKFCINELLKCLKETPNAIDCNAIAAFTTWFESLDPLQVVGIYDDLNSQITTRNGLVTETSPMLSHATGASTNAILIGNTQQASAALFYVLPYLCKSKYALEACLSALENAQRHIEKFPSVADDTGTDTRCVQHMFTKVLNDLCRSVELSDTQIALDLLNTGSEITSDSYQFFGANFGVNYFLSQQQQNQVTSLPNAEDKSCLFEAADPNTLPYQTALGGHFGPAPFYKVSKPGQDSKSIPVHYPVHWWFRGKELKNLTQMEYAALVDIKCSKSGQFSSDSEEMRHKRGRQTRKIFRFHPNHPLYESHHQVLLPNSTL